MKILLKFEAHTPSFNVLKDIIQCFNQKSLEIFVMKKLYRSNFLSVMKNEFLVTFFYFDVLMRYFIKRLKEGDLSRIIYGSGKRG